MPIRARSTVAVARARGRLQRTKTTKTVESLLSQKSKLENLSRVLQTERKDLRDELERYRQHLVSHQIPLPPWAADGDIGGRQSSALAAITATDASAASPAAGADDGGADAEGPKVAVDGTVQATAVEDR